MYVYKMLFLNRIRENRRLIKNMFFPMLSLLFVLGFVIYQIITTLFPLLKEIIQINKKALFFVFIFLVGFSFYRCFIKLKPILIVKPMTLYLFDENRIKKLLILKFVGMLTKHLIISFCLTVCICGFTYNIDFLIVLILLFCLMENTSLLSWQMYHNQKADNKKLLTVLWFVICFSILLTHLLSYIGLINLIIWGILLIHSMFRLTLNTVKYENEMSFMENILVAQNYNNTVLLSQYAQEIKLYSMSQSHKVKHVKWITKYPLAWKAGISIYRLCKGKIIIGMTIFAFSFLIYKVPVFWSFPLLEQAEIRYVMLIFGVVSVFQLTIQSIINQLDSILEKAKEGLFIPLSDKQIIMQFSIAPIIVMSCILGVLALALQNSLLQIVLVSIILISIIFISLYLELKSKKILSKYYFIITIIIFGLSFFLTVK